MAKPPKLRIPGYDFFFWPYEEQTKMKHKVLVEYFKVWATKLGKYSVINFFDCHGGCGAYEKNIFPRDDIMIYKCGLTIPIDVIDYEDFKVKIKKSEEIFKARVLINEKKVE